MAPPYILLVFLLSLSTPFLLLPYTSASDPSPNVDPDHLIMNTGSDAPANPAYNPYGEGLFSDDIPKNTKPFDEAHVSVLTSANLSSFLAAHRHVVVNFHALWCTYSRALGPEYAAAASQLAVELELDVALTKVDATEDHGVTRAHNIMAYPTILFYTDGVRRGNHYLGERTKDNIVAWVTKRLRGAVHNITTVEEAEKIGIGCMGMPVLAFLDSLSGAHSDELAAASKLEDHMTFYQTTSPDVAKYFHVDPAAKRPFIVILEPNLMETGPERKLIVSQYKHPRLSNLFLNHNSL